MSVILISSDSCERGREIAEKTAEVLGYRCLGREILASAAGKHNLPEDKLVNALDRPPSFLGMSTKLRKRYLAFVEEAVLGELLKDDVVCHSLGAHLYVLGVSHVLKVRVLSESSDAKSGKKTDVELARKSQEREKKHRRRWSLDCFRLDETDPSHYDLVISLSQLDPEEAVKIITETVSYRKFQPMTYSMKCMQDKALTSTVRAMLLARFPDVRVRADGGTVVVETRALKREKRKKAAAIKDLAGKITGVDYVEVHVINDIFRQAAESYR